MSSLLVHIQRHEWQLFCTFTYANRHTMAQKIRRSLQFKLLRRLAAMGQKRGRERSGFDRLTWLVREEFGEATQRLHCHVLISGLPEGVVTTNTCMFLMGFWEGSGGGMARVRVYNEVGQGAASYMTKGLEHVDFSKQGANSYEVGKFAADDSLMLIPSKSLIKQWKETSFASKSGRLVNADGASLAHAA